MSDDNDLALRALDLATAGLSVAKIADMLDTTVKDVKALIKAGKRQDPRDYDPDVEARRLDKMSAALWPLASQGDPETVGVVVKLMERRDTMDATIDGPRRRRQSHHETTEGPPRTGCDPRRCRVADTMKV